MHLRMSLASETEIILINQQVKFILRLSKEFAAETDMEKFQNRKGNKVSITDCVIQIVFRNLKRKLLILKISI